MALDDEDGATPAAAAADDAPLEDTDDWLAEFAAGGDDGVDVADWFAGDTAEKWDAQEDLPPDQLAALSEEDKPAKTPLLKGVPTELAAASLPDWLSDAPSADAGDGFDDAFAPDNDDLPDWMQMSDGVDFDAALDAAMPPAAPSLPTAGSSEWDDILGAAPVGDDPFDLDDLPPPSEIAADAPALGAFPLAASEMPAWMQALKPRELLEEAEKAA
jgi:hypothetical protein